jgi:hypothetical protein
MGQTLLGLFSRLQEGKVRRAGSNLRRAGNFFFWKPQACVVWRSCLNSPECHILFTTHIPSLASSHWQLHFSSLVLYPLMSLLHPSPSYPSTGVSLRTLLAIRLLHISSPYNALFFVPSRTSGSLSSHPHTLARCACRIRCSNRTS